MFPFLPPPPSLFSFRAIAVHTLPQLGILQYVESGKLVGVNALQTENLDAGAREAALGSLGGALHEEDDGGGGNGLVDGLAGGIGQPAVLVEEDGAEGGGLGRNGRPGGGGEELLLSRTVSVSRVPNFARRGVFAYPREKGPGEHVEKDECGTGNLETETVVWRKWQTNEKITAMRTEGESSAAAAVETVITTF